MTRQFILSATRCKQPVVIFTILRIEFIRWLTNSNRINNFVRKKNNNNIFKKTCNGNPLTRILVDRYNIHICVYIIYTNSSYVNELLQFTGVVNNYYIF